MTKGNLKHKKGKGSTSPKINFIEKKIEGIKPNGKKVKTLRISKFPNFK